MKSVPSFHQAFYAADVNHLKSTINEESFVSQIKIMKLYFLVLLSTVSLAGCAQSNSQKPVSKSNHTQHVGGQCEGCEAIYESPIPFDQLSSVDTLPDFNEQGPRLEISGIVYQSDGKTPAKDVIIYVYHTDQTGHYSTKGNETGWARRHGYIRGWMKTDKNGFYQFYTLKPAVYPGRTAPAHIHVIVKEPDKNEYWIDEYLFDDDPLLTKEERQRQEKRGGKGIIELVQDKGRLHGTRHILLGKNIPDYPVALDKNMKSGLAVGASCPAFDPLHLSGPDAGRQVCPMCKYGNGQGIMVWFNHANLDQMAEFVQLLEKEQRARGEKNFRVFLVYMNPFHSSLSQTSEEIQKNKIKKWCERKGLEKLAMVMVPSPEDAESCGFYRINPEATNTVFVYKKRKITSKWVNMNYDEAAVKMILQKFD